MKIIFDISVLGWSIRDEKAKTGIFRVIENLLIQFLKDKNLELYLSAIHGNYSDVSEYIKKANLGVVSNQLIFPKGKSPKRDSIFQRLNAIEYNLDKINPSFYDRIQLFVFRFFRFFADILFGLNRYKKSIPSEFRTKEFIFHSPFLPVPSYLACSELHTVVSIYDLIPVLYPEYFMGNNNHLIQKLVKYLNSKTNIITISNHSRNDIIKVIPDSARRTHVSYLAANNIFTKKLFDGYMNEVLDKYRLVPDRYIVSVSTFEPRKNLGIIIEAFLNLNNSADDIQLVLIGTEGWGPSFEETKRRFGEKFNSKVRFLGFIPDNELAFIYSGALFFVYMSLYEGFGLPPLEAMQCGLPVISSNSSSLPEVIGAAGMLIDPMDKASLKEKMELLISDSDLRKSLASLSLKQSSKFTWESTVNCVKEIYCQINEATG
ncbi:glycosyltransferase family 4 protein [Leptospira congkakensis]|nr:glycosyltransferase family 1 protein [Leptospira congkakensis]